jgi:hypothetical protein
MPAASRNMTWPPRISVTRLISSLRPPPFASSLAIRSCASAANSSFAQSKHFAADPVNPSALLRKSGQWQVNRGTGNRRHECARQIDVSNDQRDVVADFSGVRMTGIGPDRVLVTGATGHPRPETLKVSIGCIDSHIGEGQISELRCDSVGVNAMHRAGLAASHPEPDEVHPGGGTYRQPVRGRAHRQ